jgi:hypothetical protein
MMRTKENKFVYKLTEIRPLVAFCNGNMQEGGNAYAKRKLASSAAGGGEAGSFHFNSPKSERG